MISGKKKKTSRDIQAQKSKKRIHSAGISLFSSQGIDETSVADICKKAKCSVGAFYHHFPSKESILEETFRMADTDFSAWDLSEKLGISGREAILAYMNSYAELVTKSGLEFSKHFYTWKNKVFIKKGRAMQTCLIDLIRKETEAGNLKLSLSPEEACEWLFICGRGVVFHWCLHEGSFTLTEKMNQVMDQALRGIELKA